MSPKLGVPAVACSPADVGPTWLTASVFQPVPSYTFNFNLSTVELNHAWPIIGLDGEFTSAKCSNSHKKLLFCASP